MSVGPASHFLSIAVSSVFLAGALAPFLVRWLGARAPWVLASLPFLLTLNFLALAPQVTGNRIILEAYPWLNSPKLTLSLALDGLSLLMALLICGIGSLIVLYAGRYLRGHEQLGRFFAFFFLFMGSMLGIVLSDNLILTFVSWELTSIASYFLIGFDSRKEESRKAALQALLVTGAGGLAMLVGFVLLSLISGSYEISSLARQNELIRSHPDYTLALLLIAIGAFTKSAQFPFHFWLPSAMQAPAPVSAYLHSATMVKAGVFLLARLSPALGGTALWAGLLTPIGALTLLTGSFLAIQQRDIKLTLAYMTVMALGLLVLLLGLGSPAAIQALVVYLLVHSLYKGALFLVAGIVDHQAGTRDVNRLLGLGRTLRWTGLAAALSALSMAGIPLFFGFVGKELIYESLWAAEPRSWVLIAAVTASMMILVAVALLLGFKIFHGRGHPPSDLSLHEAPAALWACPLLLSLSGLYLGLAPGSFAGLGSAAATAVTGARTDIKLVRWHGVSPALLLSGVSVLGGILLYWSRERAQAAFQWLTQRTAFLGPQRGYEASLQLLKSLSQGLTSFLQSGRLSSYILWAVISVSGALVTLGALSWIRLGEMSWSQILYYEWILAALMVLGALAAASSSSPLVSVTCLGVLGYAISLTYVIYGAPDLAMTQFLVETLTVILLALVLSKLPGYPRSNQPFARKSVSLAISASAGLLMTALIWKTLERPFDRSLSDYFSEHSLPLAHGRNIVNVILVDFRALDTLGEITVLGVAALGIFGLVRLGSKAREKA